VNPPPAAAWPAATLVLIPAWNEAACVAATVARWRALGLRRVRVVDNGSTDATAAVARAAGAEVVAEPRRGYGAAAWRGLQDWPNDCAWALFSSADGSDRLGPAELPAWQAAVDAGADLVLGDRTARPESRRALRPVQRFGNALQCAVIAAGWGRRFGDMASLRLVRRAALDRLRLADRAFGWNVEMQVRTLELGLHCVEQPVTFHPRAAGESKISGNWLGTWRAGTGILRTLAWLWRLHRARTARLAAALPAPAR
jgi:glycosyltransferase involved in cell wall biosynthesis